MKTIDVYAVKATYSNYEQYEDFYTYDKVLSVHPTFKEAEDTIFGNISIDTLEDAGFAIHECFTEMAEQVLFGHEEDQNNRMLVVKDDGLDSSDVNEALVNVRRTITFNPDGCSWHKFDIRLTIERLPMTIIDVDAFMEELK